MIRLITAALFGFVLLAPPAVRAQAQAQSHASGEGAAHSGHGMSSQMCAAHHAAMHGTAMDTTKAGGMRGMAGHAGAGHAMGGHAMGGHATAGRDTASHAMQRMSGHMCPMHADHADHAFHSMQERGSVGMGVDQYTSTHRFDSLDDGGRIEFLLDADDPEGVTAIRAHLAEIAAAFSEGDFTTPAFIHGETVPGTDVMQARRNAIRYHVGELPRGGELRIITRDPMVLKAIHTFMEYQRADHRAGGHPH